MMVPYVILVRQKKEDKIGLKFKGELIRKGGWVGVSRIFRDLIPLNLFQSIEFGAMGVVFQKRMLLGPYLNWVYITYLVWFYIFVWFASYCIWIDLSKHIKKNSNEGGENIFYPIIHPLLNCNLTDDPIVVSSNY